MKEIIPHHIIINSIVPASPEQLLVQAKEATLIAKKKDLIRRLDIAVELAEQLNEQVKIVFNIPS